MMATALRAAPSSTEAIDTRPSSSTSILQPVRSTIERIILPPGPMMSRILSTGTLMVMMRGAYVLMLGRASGSASSILSRM